MSDDPGYPNRKSEAERLNLLAHAAKEGWGWLPLSVRYEAARAADELVRQWRATGRTCDCVNRLILGNDPNCRRHGRTPSRSGVEVEEA